MQVLLYLRNCWCITKTLVDFAEKIKDLYLKSSLHYGIITETWLTDTHLSSEIFVNNTYNVYRKDRSSSLTSLSKGGRVIIAVRADLSSHQLALTAESSSVEIDQLIVKVSSLNKKDLFVFASYIPPKSSIDVHNIHFKNCNMYIHI